LPSDPLMIESFGPRSGQNPITGDVLTTVPGGNAINGNEYSIPENDDLQYACVWTIPQTRDCSDSTMALHGCDCTKPDNDNPLCDPSGQHQVQVRAKASPGLRQLRVLQGLGDQGVVASICAPNIDDPSQADYAYRPAIAALVERMTPRLQ